MMILRVLLFVTLAVRGLDCVGAGRLWSSPINFFYKDTDVLDIDIVLQNVPPGTTDFITFFHIHNCDSNINNEQNKQQGSSCIELANKGTIQRDELIYVTRILTEPSVSLYIELRISNKICSRKRFVVGNRDEHADENVFHKGCLKKTSRPCQIIVDFGSKCEDNIDCRLSRGHFTCESTNEELLEDTVHKWYQRYSDGSSIGYIPPVKGKYAKFKMELQNFDLTTYIYSILSTQWNKVSNTGVVQIPSTTNGYKEYHVNRSQSYSENKQFTFTCPHKAHTQIGWIDPTGYKITTYNVTSYTKSFMKIDNSSLLCCLHFNTYTNRYEATVERSVDDITVLIYEEPEKHENVNVSPVPVNKTNEKSPVVDDKSSDDSPGPDDSNSDDSPGPDDKTRDESIVTVVPIIAVSLGVGVFLGFLITLLLVIKCRRVTPNTGALPQANVPKNPFYVNILFRKECEREIWEGEHIYEEIN